MGVHRRSSRQLFYQYLRVLRGRGSAEQLPFRAERRRRGSQRGGLQLLAEFLCLLRGQYGALAYALGTLTVATCLALVPPAVTKIVVDNVLGDRPLAEPLRGVLQRLGAPAGDRGTLLVACVLLVVFASLLRVVIHLSGRWVATRLTKRLQIGVRKQLFEHVIRLPLHRIQQLRSGGVASVLREDGGAVGELVFAMLYNPWRAVVQLTGSLIVLGWVDWRLLLGALGMLPALYFAHRTWVRRIRPLYRDIRAQREHIDGHATEVFAGIRVVRGFARERAEAWRYVRNTDLMTRQELFVWWWSRVLEAVWETLIPLGSAALLLYGGWRVLQGVLTLGDLMMFLAYLLMLLEPLAVLAQSSAQFQNGLSALDRVLDLLSEPVEMLASRGGRPLPRQAVRGRIELCDVWFRYPEQSRWALRAVTLKVPEGCTVALVGPSGAGKTTLCNLVARFYDPTRGTIRLDGTDIRSFDVESYRRILGIVEQDVFLFDGTVAENIGYARSGATLEEIRRAARIAHAAEFIDQLPNGYETLIGERGVRLSGGQRQRIAIARAVLADPKILILDEATSNLDTESERLIQAALRDLMRDRTAFVIAHRLSTVRHADCIVVLEDGAIREIGTHEQLLAADGRYREMLLSQTNAGDPQVAFE